MLDSLNSVRKRKPVSQRSPSDTNMYIHLDELEDEMKANPPYTLFELDDVRMGIRVEDIPDRKLRYKEQKKFAAAIQFLFPVRIFTYQCQGSVGDWTVVVCMVMGDNKAHHNFVAAIVDATKDAPRQLSHRQTEDSIATISRATG